MNTIAASIVVLAGAAIFGAGMVAGAIKTDYGMAGEVVGSILLLVGLAVFAAGTLKPLWDAIPIDGKKKDPVETTSGSDKSWNLVRKWRGQKTISRAALDKRLAGR